MHERASLDELFPPFAWLRKAHPRQAQDIELVWRLYRDFGREFVAPVALTLDEADAQALARGQRELLAHACRRRLFGATLPVVYGGLGLPLIGLLPGLEELARHCTGVANLVSVHGLGLALVGATGNLRILGELCQRLIASEARGEPELIATAATEPSAGTDMENVELLGIAKLAGLASPVAGGHVLNGRKVFVSNGSLASHVIVLMPTERAAPAATMKAFWIRSSTTGFVVENIESKMGQRACPAATLAFTDCFVPERDCIGAIGGRELDLVLGSTRGAVAAYGAGIASSALERALGWARQARDRPGQRPLDAQWVKLRVSEIQRCVWQARAAYWAAAAANDGFGLSSLTAGTLHQAQHWIPRLFVDAQTTRAISMSSAIGAAARVKVSGLPEWKVALAAAWGAAAKVSASDLAVQACELAMEITGSAGLRHEFGLEKLLRDAKLLQIYEGTNELNRLELFAKTTGDSLVSNPSSSTRALAPSFSLQAALMPRPEDAELDELVRTVERWLIKRAPPPQTQGSHHRAPGVSAEILAELMDLGAPQMACSMDKGGAGATPSQLAHVLVTFGRRAPEIGALLMAHWLATAFAPERSDQQGSGAWCAFPLYEDLWTPAEPLRVDSASAHLRGRIALVVGANHAEYLVLPVLLDDSRTLEWCRFSQSMPGVCISAPAQTHGLSSAAACDVEVNLARAQWQRVLLQPSRERGPVASSALVLPIAYSVALCLGVLESSAELTSEYVAARRQGGRALLDHDAIAEMLGDLSVDLTTVSAALEALLDPSVGEPARLGLLLRARAATLRGTDIGIRALGGYGYLTPYLQERRHRDARQACEILGRTALLRLRLREILGGHP